ncbi:MFS transporter [Auraticoccus sp. F435]|uniref:MFS transporter n=1 Tax=Auraticoccus cholistanensis TaxID=2656650 RepID=A0A6A9UNY9_9ACTN|nr:MFS transporter [Auraticoccus cholistanensis]MVA74586.1 MFS transporter [Auraticoccus cholistanensis]
MAPWPDGRVASVGLVAENGWVLEFVQALRRLWRHQLFRRLLAVRIATQASDGILQVGMASYLLFNPQTQTSAWAIAGVLAITLLPFSVVGPFVSGILDRWDRRQVVLVADALRIGLGLVLAALVLAGTDRAWAMSAFYVTVLVAMSINRFVMAGMSAALPHTVDPDEYLVASSVMPTVGPAGVIVGAGTALGIRTLLGPLLGVTAADALVFLACALGFAVSVVLALLIPRGALGPDARERAEARSRQTDAVVRDVLSGLRDALGHLREHRPAGLGLVTIGLQRIAYGVVTVAVIVIYRNTFYTVEEATPAIAALGLWAGATGAGFVLAAVVTPFVTARTGLRRWVVLLLALAAVVQLVPGSIVTQPTLVASGFLLGVAAQSLKICVDTLVQAHVEDEYKGRVFVLYDMVFNTTQVLAAVLAALLLPPSGVSLPVLLAVAVSFALVAVLFAVRSRRIGAELFERGTEDLLAAPAARS